jgi:hypothetical protein
MPMALPPGIELPGNLLLLALLLWVPAGWWAMEWVIPHAACAAPARTLEHGAGGGRSRRCCWLGVEQAPDAQLWAPCGPVLLLLLLLLL